MFEVRQLNYIAGGRLLLHSMDLVLQPGQIHVLLGENGAGKSTLLRCLSGALTPSSGELLLDGKGLHDWSLQALAKKRAHLAQRLENTFAFSVRQLVGLGLEIQEDKAHRHALLQDILQCFDLTSLADRSISTLSGGELQRAHFARAMAQIWPKIDEPTPDFTGKWLLLDEWNAGLDLRHQVSLGRKLKTWRSQGLGIVMVLHDLFLAQALADRCLLLKHGKLLFSGPVDEAMQPERMRQLLEVEVYRDTARRYLWVDF
ncbi:ATP-binding cassette domain-containing protein [Thiomicrorhabdus sp.]|uniref:ATP-binding cassette domain-containing protein n=1 Tax=Thiomicrorhabdus sp. TaxID=2039724 RepID=UPI0029C9197B|nr:ATP-binding cassette domain-containing protein [Thiomicrorhabdus sp.]